MELDRRGSPLPTPLSRPSIGLVLQSVPEAGGVHQYAQMLLASLARLRPGEIIVFGSERFPPKAPTLRPASPPGTARARARKAVLLVTRTLARKGLLRPSQITVDPVMHAWFKREAPAFLIYPSTTATTFEARYPCIVAVHDLQHCLQPNFPEVSAGDGLRRRAYLFDNAIRAALLVLAESDVGKEDILRYYGHTGISADRIHVLPYLPPPYLSAAPGAGEAARVARQYRLPATYLLYPAQFWSHKNHERIVRAVGQLRQKGRDVSVVFAGSQREPLQRQTYRRVLAAVEECGLADLVRFLGFVPDEDVPGLYAGAMALVMPTFFGPTNIPFLEAWVCGCPVITSDMRGIREQVGAAALLVDPTSVDSIAGAIERVWLLPDLRQDLADLGRRRLATYTQGDFDARLERVLGKAQAMTAGAHGRA